MPSKGGTTQQYNFLLTFTAEELWQKLLDMIDEDNALLTRERVERTLGLTLRQFQGEKHLGATPGRDWYFPVSLRQDEVRSSLLRDPGPPAGVGPDVHFSIVFKPQWARVPVPDLCIKINGARDDLLRRGWSRDTKRDQWFSPDFANYFTRATEKGYAALRLLYSKRYGDSNGCIKNIDVEGFPWTEPLKPGLSKATAIATPDCAKAAPGIESLMCHHPYLRDLDRQVAEAYATEIKASGPRRAADLRSNQSMWLKARGPLCGIPRDPPQPRARRDVNAEECLIDLYEIWIYGQNWRMKQGVSAGSPFVGVEFPATRYPFLPLLTTSRDPKLCNAFVAGMQAAFLSEGISDQTNSSSWFPVEGGEWLVWPSVDTRKTHDSIKDVASGMDVLPVAFGDGRVRLLIQVAQPIGIWRNRYFTKFILLIADTDKQEAVEEYLARTPWKSGQWTPGDDVPFRLVVQTEEQDYYTREKGGSPFRVLRHAGHYYLQEGSRLSAITVDGRLNEVCVVANDTLPSDAAFSERQDVERLKKIGAPVVATDPALAVLLQSIRSVQGGWSSHYLYARTPEAIRLATTRPWTLLVEGMAPWGVRYHLREWSYAKLTNFRLFRAFRAAEQSALHALTNHYRDSFGMAAQSARNAAAEVLDRILSASFVFPSGDYVPAEDRVSDDPMQIVNTPVRSWGITDSGPLRRACLLGLPVDTVAALLKAPGPKGTICPAEPVLDYALEHPGLMALLLANGVDPNEGNGWGKTPLMYAAHFDLPEAAGLLLKHGADINAKTNLPVDDCDYAITIYDRTALMYAAENASAGLIEMLIAKGADSKAKDSDGRTVADYLKLNPGLHPEERERIRALLGR